jgi:hypothetical protein
VSKATAILVKAHRPLRFLPPADLQALERIIFHWFSGLDAVHNKRWRLAWKRLFHATVPQPVWQLYDLADRSGPYHARHMAIEGRIFENQDGFLLREGFRKWLKTGAAFGHYEASGGHLVFVPSSLSYDDCSDAEMREFHEDAMVYLRTPLALETLWPVVKPHQRIEMLEAALRPPEGEEQP